MKKLFLMLVLGIITSFVFAQSPVGKNKTQFNAGVGFSSWGIPVYIGLDYGVHQDISVGGEISFQSYDDNYKAIKYHHSVIGISGNANYHFNRILDIPSNWDFYAGLNVGFYIWNSPNDYSGSHSSGLGLGGQIGGRYYFSQKFGLNLEFGGNNAFSSGKFGMSIKI